MKGFRTVSFLNHFTRILTFGIGFFCATSLSAFAADGAADSVQPKPEVKRHEVVLSSISRSGKLERFKLKNPVQIDVGAILLIQRGGQSISAVRVMQNAHDFSDVVVKIAKRYATAEIEKVGEDLIALELIRSGRIEKSVGAPPTAREFEDELKLDFEPPAPIVPPAPETPPADAGSNTIPAESPPPAEEAKQQELPITKDYDPELDKGLSPHPDELDDSLSNFEEVDEIPTLDRDHQWLTAGLGIFQNNNFPTNTAEESSLVPYFGAEAKYSYSTTSGLFFRKKSVQDSIGPEVGVAVYRILGYQTEKDSYTIAPLLVSLRYNLVLGEYFTIYFAGGVLKNTVVTTTEGSEAALAKLNSTLPAIGGGIFFTVGPKWRIRVHLGYESITAGATLRF